MRAARRQQGTRPGMLGASMHMAAHSPHYSHHTGALAACLGQSNDADACTGRSFASSQAIALGELVSNASGLC
jgi:hypothetical protein